MRRLCAELPFTCGTCEVEISGRPEFYAGMSFCCAGCVAGGPCNCSYDEPASAPGAAPMAAVGPPIEVRECVDVRAEPLFAGVGRP